jgi:hypothetical protein
MFPQTSQPLYDFVRGSKNMSPFTFTRINGQFASVQEIIRISDAGKTAQ